MPLIDLEGNDPTIPSQGEKLHDDDWISIGGFESSPAERSTLQDLEEYEADVAVGVKQRNGNLSPVVKDIRLAAAFEEGKAKSVETKRKAKAFAAALPGGLPAALSGHDPVAEMLSAGYGSIISSYGNMLTFMDRALVSKDPADIGALDIMAERARGTGEGLRDQKEISDLLYDIGGAAGSVGVSAAAYYAGGPLLATVLTAGLFGLGQGGEDALEMESKYDPVTNKALATPDQVARRMYGSALLSSILESWGAKGVTTGVSVTGKVAKVAGKGLGKAVSLAPGGKAAVGAAQAAGAYVSRGLEVGKRYTSRWAQDWIAGGIDEGTTEALQTIASRAITETVDPTADWWNAKLASDSLYAGMIGFIAGGGASIVHAKRKPALDAAKAAVAGDPEAVAQVEADEAKYVAEQLDALKDPSLEFHEKAAILGDLIGKTKEELEADLEEESIAFYHEELAREQAATKAFEKPRYPKRKKPEPMAGVEPVEGFIQGPQQLNPVKAFGEVEETPNIELFDDRLGRMRPDPAGVWQILKDTLPEGADESEIGEYFEHVTTNIKAVEQGGLKARSQLREEARQRKKDQARAEKKDVAGQTPSPQEGGDPTRALLADIKAKRKAEEEIDAAGLGGGGEDVAPNKVSLTYWTGRKEIILRDLRYIASQINTNLATANGVIDEVMQNWGVLSLEELTSESSLNRLLQHAMDKKFPGQELGEVFDRVFDGNIEDDSDYEVFNSTIEEAFATPEEKYDLYQLVETAMIADQAGRGEAMAFSTAGITAPYAAIKNLKPDDIGVVRVMLRKGAKAELNGNEQELRVNPEDIIIKPSKEAVSAGRVPTRSLMALEPDDIAVVETKIKNPETKRHDIEYFVNGRSYLTRRVAAVGPFQFVALDGETGDTIAKGKSRKALKRRLQRLALEAIQGGEPIVGPDTFLEGQKKYRQVIAEKSADMERARVGFEAADPKQYMEAQKKNPRASTLTPYSLKDLASKKVKIFKKKGAEAYFLLKNNLADDKPNFEIAGLFSNTKGANAIKWAIETALAQTEGYTVPLILDAFEGHLTKSYGDMGFVEHERFPFDPKYSTPEQIKALQQEEFYKRTGKMPDVVFMHHKDRPWDGKVQSEQEAADDADLDQAEMSALGFPTGLRRSAEEIIASFHEHLPSEEDMAIDSLMMRHDAIQRKIKEIEALPTSTLTGKFSHAPRAGSRFKRKVRPQLPELNNARTVGPGESYALFNARPVYIFELMQGDKPVGPITSIFHDPFVPAGAMEQEHFHSERGIVGRFNKMVQAYGGIDGWGRRFALRQMRESDPAGIPLTGMERVGIALSLLDGDHARHAQQNGGELGNGKSTRPLTEEEMKKVAANLTKDEKYALAYQIAHYRSQAKDIERVSRQLGIPFEKKDFYIPIYGQRQLNALGEELVADPAQIIKGVRTKEDFAKTALPDWFTRARTELGNTVRPRFDSFNVMLEQGKQATHWIYNAVPLAQALEVLNNPGFRDMINRKFGQAAVKEAGPEWNNMSMLQILDTQIKDIARGSVNATSRGEGWMRTLRKNAAVASLGLKVGVMLKQPISIINGLLEFSTMQAPFWFGGNPIFTFARMASRLPYSSMRVLGGMFNPKGQDKISQAIEQMPILREREQGEGIDPEVDLLMGMLAKPDLEGKIKGKSKAKNVMIAGNRVSEKIARMSMKGIILMDRYAVRAVADMVVREGMANGMSLEDAVAAAQRTVEKTQAMSGTRYLSMAYRSGEFTRMMMMFTGELNQQGNLILQAFRKSFPQMSIGNDDEERILSAFVMVIMGMLAGNYINAVIDSAGRAADPTAEGSMDLYKANLARHVGTTMGGFAGGFVSGVLVNQLYYDGAFGDTPTSPAAQAVSKLAQTGKNIYDKKPSARSEEDYIRLSRDLAGVVGSFWGKPLQGLLNFAIGWKDAVDDGSVTPSDIDAILGFSRFQRGEQGKGTKKAEGNFQQRN